MCQAVLFALTLVLDADGNIAQYRDGRPAAKLRLDAADHGVVLRYGDGPDQCDIHGARDVWVYQADGSYYMHYDAAGGRDRRFNSRIRRCRRQGRLEGVCG